MEGLEALGASEGPVAWSTWFGENQKAAGFFDTPEAAAIAGWMPDARPSVVSVTIRDDRAEVVIDTAVMSRLGVLQSRPRRERDAG